MGRHVCVHVRPFFRGFQPAARTALAHSGFLCAAARLKRRTWVQDGRKHLKRFAPTSLKTQMRSRLCVCASQCYPSFANFSLYTFGYIEWTRTSQDHSGGRPRWSYFFFSAVLRTTRQRMSIHNNEIMPIRTFGGVFGWAALHLPNQPCQ